jgi:hypothetical protein
MNAQPEIGGRAPLAIDVEAVKKLLVVRLRALEESTVLRRFAQGHAILPGRVEGGSSGADLVLRLQAHRQPADV